MKTMKLTLIIACLFVVISSMSIHAETIEGTVGASSKWNSGWIDLNSVMHFQKGDKLKILVGGSAKKVLLRFLSGGMEPNTASGIDGGMREVPEDRVLTTVVQSVHQNVTQISVHGGPNPFGLMPLGSGNGPATIISIERESP